MSMKDMEKRLARRRTAEIVAAIYLLAVAVVVFSWYLLH